MRADADKGKVEVRKEVSIRPKNRVEGDRNGNGMEQVRLNNVRAKCEEETGKHGEWLR